MAVVMTLSLIHDFTWNLFLLLSSDNIFQFIFDDFTCCSFGETNEGKEKQKKKTKQTKKWNKENTKMDEERQRIILMSVSRVERGREKS